MGRVARRRDAPKGVQAQADALRDGIRGQVYFLPTDDDRTREAADNRTEGSAPLVPGTFRIGPVPAGELTVVAGATGFDWDEIKVEVASGETLRGLNFRLQRPVTVEGRVTDVQGRPLARTRVMAVGAKWGVPGFGWTDTDDDGNYRLTMRWRTDHFARAPAWVCPRQEVV